MLGVFSGRECIMGPTGHQKVFDIGSIECSIEALNQSFKETGEPGPECAADTVVATYNALQEAAQSCLNSLRSAHGEGSVKLVTSCPKVGDIIHSDELAHAVRPYHSKVVRVNYECHGSQYGNKGTRVDDPTRCDADWEVIKVDTADKHLVHIARLDTEGARTDDVVAFNLTGPFALKKAPTLVKLAIAAQPEELN